MKRVRIAFDSTVAQVKGAERGEGGEGKEEGIWDVEVPELEGV